MRAEDLIAEADTPYFGPIFFLFDRFVLVQLIKYDRSPGKSVVFTHRDSLDVLGNERLRLELRPANRHKPDSRNDQRRK
jgi:hypothetical protein